MPEVTIIIPTHNRRAVLQQTLAALVQQTYPLGNVEVIVVADGCQDDTAEFVNHYAAPYALHLVQQPGWGPAQARNSGAQRAASPLLIFLDDDIEVAPDFIAAHVAIHRARSQQVAIGYLPPRLHDQTGFFRLLLQFWWENMFDRMRQPGHRYAYTDLLSGNFSLPFDLFWHVDGFDVNFTCHEDYELGYRLLRAGAQFVFVPEAVGRHHEFTDLNRALHRKRQEGLADVALGQKYPELRPTLPLTSLYHFARRPSRILFRLVHLWPGLADGLARLVQWSLPWWERLRLRGLWQRLLDGLLAYWYWRGVAEALPEWWKVRQFVRGNRAAYHSAITLDLALGAPRAARLLDDFRPETAVLYHGEQAIGQIPPQPGAERLNGRHLHSLLTTRLMAATLKTLALAGEMEIPVDIDLLVEACDEIIQKQARFEAARA